LFQPLSLRKSCIPKYITLDTASLIRLFMGNGMKQQLLTNVKENKSDVWKMFFRMNMKIFNPQKEYIFNYTLQTDGIGCSLLFRHRSIEDKKHGQRVDSFEINIPYIDNLSDDQFAILKNKKIVSGDPGKKYLMYMMDDEGNELKYSCMKRDTESLAKRNRKITLANKKKSNYEVIKYETELSKYSSNTVDYDKFKQFIWTKHWVNEQTKHFYEENLYRKLNWRKKTYRQRSEDRFLNNIENKFGSKEDIVVCLGDWSNKNTIKGLAPTMGIGLKRIISKKFTTMLIDEYNTSKKCCNCWQNVENVSIKGDKKFRLLGCRNCKRNNIGSLEDENQSMFQTYSFLTRDKNSCINMISIVKHMMYQKRKRPKEFSRCS